MEKNYIDNALREDAFVHLFINSPIDESLYDEVSRLTTAKLPRTMVLTLVDNVGTIHEAYRLAQLLQMTFPQLAINVQGRASAMGTLIACASSVLVVNPASTLCPLEVPLDADEAATEVVASEMQGSIFEHLGLQSACLQATIAQHLVDHTHGGVAYDSAAKFAGETTVGLMSGIYAQFPLEKMIARHRSLRTIERYAENLAGRHGNLRDGGIRELIYGFPSPD